MRRYIFGMSKGKKDLESWIEDHTFPTMCALAQLYLFPYFSAKNHWKQEVWSSFNSMHLLKTNNKLPSAQFIYDSSWGIDSVYAKDAINWAIAHESNLTPISDIDIDFISEVMSEYFRWLSNQLSKTKFLVPEHVYRKLEELGIG